MQSINVYTPHEKEEKGVVYEADSFNENDYVMPSIETVVDEKTGLITHEVVFKKAPDDREHLKVSDFSLCELLAAGINPEDLPRMDYGHLPESSVDQLVELCKKSETEVK